MNIFPSISYAAAIAFVNSTSTTAGATTTITATYSPTAGNTVVLGLSTSNSATRSATIADNNGNAAVLQANVCDSTWCSFIFTATAVSGATSYKAMLTGGSAGDSVLSVAEYSGVSAIGKNATGTGASANATISITTQNANNFVIANFAGDGTVYNAGTGILRETKFINNIQRVGGGLNENSSTVPASVTNAASQNFGSLYAAAAVELQLSAAATPSKKHKSPILSSF
jgi:hypothetical protein